MCITEYWIYQDCGCRYERHLPCKPPFDLDLQKYSQKAQHPCALLFSLYPGQSHLPPSPCSTDSERIFDCLDNDRRNMKKQTTRQCSIRQTVHKQFLEPICDDCVVEEMGRTYNPDFVPFISSHNPEQPLVWGSEVKIEIEPIVEEEFQDSPTEAAVAEIDTQILESNVEIRIDPAPEPTAFHDHLVSTIPKPSHLSPNPSPLSSFDADDEDSLYPSPIRGRQRSRTKQFKRRGIDLSRENFRISSRLSSGEKRSMESFRDVIQGRLEMPTKAFVQRLTVMHEESRNLAKSIIGSVRGRVSRSHGRRGRMVDASTQTENKETTNSSEFPKSTLSTVVGSEQEVTNAPTNHKISSSSSGIIQKHYTNSNSSCTIPRSTSSRRSPSSWQAHLDYDLSHADANDQHASLALSSALIPNESSLSSQSSSRRLLSTKPSSSSSTSSSHSLLHHRTYHLSPSISSSNPPIQHHEKESPFDAETTTTFISDSSSISNTLSPPRKGNTLGRHFSKATLTSCLPSTLHPISASAPAPGSTINTGPSSTSS